jgi:hypothetical protein
MDPSLVVVLIAIRIGGDNPNLHQVLMPFLTRRSSMKAEPEQKDCARAVRRSVHGILAAVQVSTLPEKNSRTVTLPHRASDR